MSSLHTLIGLCYSVTALFTCQDTGNADPFGSLLSIELGQVCILEIPVAAKFDVYIALKMLRVAHFNSYSKCHETGHICIVTIQPAELGSRSNTLMVFFNRARRKQTLTVQYKIPYLFLLRSTMYKHCVFKFQANMEKKSYKCSRQVETATVARQ